MDIPQHAPGVILELNLQDMKIYFTKSIKNKNNFTAWSTFSFIETFGTACKQGRKDIPLRGIYSTEISRYDFMRFNQDRRGVVVVDDMRALAR